MKPLYAYLNVQLKIWLVTCEKKQKHGMDMRINDVADIYQPEENHRQNIVVTGIAI